MTSMTGAPLIQVRDLVQRIGTQEILKGVSLDVHPGETLVLLGKSGGGKSVFLRHLIGLMRPLSGEIVFEGTPEQLANFKGASNTARFATEYFKRRGWKL